MSEVPREIVRHYDATDEDARIRHGFSQLELVRTQAIIRRFLPQRSLTILDVGGATGVHAAWLAEDATGCRSSTSSRVMLRPQRS
jgi:2-polyprenyl-3-methyl-5-hydroxy-6-metoxy-1,4-benzoquinol methylase